ncbi:sulfite exporter TauE/SafE family protein [Natronolimnohabitans sp. A-GB9]|uniref:sulfite exporter TauE/SafE family protein n=1 Tax=Natronolimnohabitans sp. A-GB9 TaxID=3069757 RepID=UPI0027B1CE78|nr:sulfite exporter TauE/SafE family protein [Natronolimnohabitans sp. A-GB9]MDQ2052509.1 sulfite exporter TauE/SafE family protein [Natronolimnohabitans sp. A-GB9]
MVVATEILIALLALSFLGGVIVATIGPGGILIVTGLYLLTSLSSAEVAGTSSAVFTIGAVFGSGIYARSGEIDWLIAGVVSGSAAAGTWVGVQANAYLSREAYGLLLAALLAVVGCTIVYREYRDLEPRVELGRERRDLAAFGGVGLVIGVFGGLLGIGGAALSAPALVLVGVPMLVTIAVTQLVVVFTALFTAINYWLLDAIVGGLFAPITAAYLGGVGLGWWLAHRIDAGRLKLSLGVVLVALALSLVV